MPSPDVARAPDTSTPRPGGGSPASATSAPSAAPVVRKDAPRPADMMPLFAKLEQASGLFVAGQLRARRSRCSRPILAADPHNLDAALRLATAHSSLGHGREGAGRLSARRRASRRIAGRADVPRAALRAGEGVGARRAAARAGGDGDPERLTRSRRSRGCGARQGQAGDGRGGRTGRGDLAAFERARGAASRAAFKNDLELGVLYLAARRFAGRAAALDRVLAGASRRSDGAVQARAGERAAERARRAARGSRSRARRPTRRRGR